MANRAQSLSRTKWMCRYHIVLASKYRREIIHSQYRGLLGEIFRQPCGRKGVEVIEGRPMPGHVHSSHVSLLRSFGSRFMGCLKGKSSLMMFERRASLKCEFGNRRLWSEGYYSQFQTLVFVSRDSAAYYARGNGEERFEGKGDVIPKTLNGETSDYGPQCVPEIGSDEAGAACRA